MKKYLLIATALVALASCSDDTFVGENSPNTNDTYGGDIKFGLSMQKMTRADIYGGEAAKLLGNHFYVMGTKGTGTGDEVEPANSPTTSLVFDNYLVHYGVNTAGKTESNTANWEYVGVTPDGTNYVKLSSLNAQTIKYWDYSTKSYDFFAFSTGPNNAVSNTSPAAGNIGVTNMAYGASITSGVTVYTLYVPTVEDLAETYITDIIKVAKSNYGKEVQLKFKNVGSKVRIALYETVPGYSVKEVKFYKVDAGASPSDLGSSTETDAYLIGAAGDTKYSFPTAGQIDVAFAHVGASNKSMQDYDKATATVTATAGSEKFKSFDALNYTGKDPSGYEAPGNYYLGRDLPHATFAGSADADYYKTVFPVTTCYPLTLRVDYTLVSTDGSGEEIKVYGAKAVVPATYTKWLPNYAYTYIFKISDNTNGWTSTTSTDPAGLFPITFDAVVAEAIDATAEQRTVTTVATPTITTYQQYHDAEVDEYSKSVKDLKGTTVDRDLYVQVMNNKVSPAELYTDLNGTTPTDGTNRSLLYAITGTAPISEATVMDALENQASVSSGTITGRNGMILTPHAGKIDATVESIVNGVDDNAITVTKGHAAKIDMSAVDAGNYAYVYDYTSAAGGKVKEEIYQPIATVTGADPTPVGNKKFITTTDLDKISTTTAANEAVDHAYIYFSKTNKTLKSGGDPTDPNDYTYTYSFVSVDGKKTLPAGLIKVATSSLGTTASSATAEDNTFYFDIYTRNDGKYAVKVIKIV